MNNKIVVISGASRGLGRELSRQLSQRGYTVIGFARSTGLLKGLEEELHTSEGSFIGYHVDITDIEEISKVVKLIIKKWKRIDIVIANAGIADSGWATTKNPKQIKYLFEVNFMGMINLFSPIIPFMLKQGKGHLSAIASVAAYRGLPALSAYSASKAAMKNYLEALRVELRSRGIKVTTISPGYIKTDMTAAGERPMPFILTVEKAAKLTIRALEGNSSEVVFPLPFALMVKLLKFLPNSLYDKLISNF